MFYVCVLFFCSFGILPQAFAEPWGRDADLCVRCGTVQASPKHSPNHALNQLAEMLIGFHQKVISPADGPRSHYVPCSSQYTLEAIRSKGFFIGVIRGCDRLMRENSDPWIYRTRRTNTGKVMKWDPIL